MIKNLINDITLNDKGDNITIEYNYKQVDSKQLYYTTAKVNDRLYTIIKSYKTIIGIVDRYNYYRLDTYFSKTTTSHHNYIINGKNLYIKNVINVNGKDFKNILKSLRY